MVVVLEISRKLAMDMLDSEMIVNDDEENGCRFEYQRKDHWIPTRPAWFIAVRERLLEFYSD